MRQRPCGPGAAPPDQGRFFTGHRPPRWVCDRCIKLFKLPNLPSPGEKRLAALLIEHRINFIPQHVIQGRPFDFYLPDWNLIIEVDSWSAHHTAAQKKKDYWRDKIARLHGIHLVRINWKARDMLEQVQAARPAGLALQRERS